MMRIDMDKRTVEVNGQLVPLTSMEYSVLELLAERKGSVVTKDVLMHYLYNGIDVPERKIIDVFVCKLRRKLYVASGGKNYVDTVWGRGYMMQQTADAELEATPEMAAL